MTSIQTLSVNTPFITSFTNDSCVDPPFVQTRFTGGSFTDIAVYNETTGLFKYGNFIAEGVNRCINGDCSLPGELPVVDDSCSGSVSVFTVDYDAPLGPEQGGVRAALSPLVHFESRDRMSVKARNGLSSKWRMCAAE
jgi:5'-nucleotidase